MLLINKTFGDSSIVVITMESGSYLSITTKQYYGVKRWTVETELKDFM